MGPFLQVTTTGTCTTSHLGQVLLRAIECVVPGPTAFTFIGGELVLTAANGDTVTVDYSGTLAPSGDLSPAVLSGTFRVTGGTGRFVGATGSGFLSCFEGLTTRQGGCKIEGTLSY